MYNERILQYEHETMGKEIRDLLYRYQGNIWLDSVGRSFDDREIYRIIVGNRTAEKKILFTGAIHGREYMTAKLLVKQTEHFLQYMCEGGNEDFDVAVHVIPMVNPDGAALCHRGIEGIRKKELKEKLLKIKEKEDFVRWKSNARGVDLNRNFDAFGRNIPVKNKNLLRKNIKAHIRSQRWKQKHLQGLQERKNFRQP